MFIEKRTRREAYLCCLEVDEHMVVFVDRVGVRMRRLAPSLEVLATNEAAIDVLVRH